MAALEQAAAEAAGLPVALAATLPPVPLLLPDDEMVAHPAARLTMAAAAVTASALRPVCLPGLS